MRDQSPRVDSADLPAVPSRPLRARGVRGISRRRVLVGVGLFLLAAAILSLTVGRDLYSGRTPDLASFTLVHFAGYLFFIVMPVEVLVPWYLEEGHAAAPLLGLAVATALAAQLIDYGIGRVVSDRLVPHAIGYRRLTRARGTIERYGQWAILLFNLTPLSSPVLLAAAGVVRFGLLRAMAWSAAGLVLKYAAIVWLFHDAAAS